MKCLFCKVTFDPAHKAVIGIREFNFIELKTKCPSCGESFYIIISNQVWHSERHALALQRKHRKATRANS